MLHCPKKFVNKILFEKKYVRTNIPHGARQLTNILQKYTTKDQC